MQRGDSVEQKLINDFEIMIQSIQSVSAHQFAGTMLLFVVEGTITVSMDGEEYFLQESDILIINRNTIYSIIGDSSNVVVSLAITNHFFKMQYEAYYHYVFECFSKKIDTGREEVLAQLRRLLAKMVIAHLQKGEDSSISVQSDLYQVLLMMIRFFKKSIPYQEQIELEDERITRILNHIEHHYGEPLSLTHMANQEFLSPSYFSRYFKQFVGINFSKYLTNVRLKHSKEDLIHSSDSLFQIASRNGFSTAKQFALAFKTAYEQTPASYRKKHKSMVPLEESMAKQNTGKSSILDSPEVLVKLTKYCDKEMNQTLLGNDFTNEKLLISPMEQTKTALIHEKHIVFIGELKDILNENIKKQILMANDSMRINYIGIRNLIGGSTILPEINTDEAISTISIYANADLALRTIKDSGFSIFLRINVNEILYFEDYFSKLRAFLNHAVQVFGKEFVQKWHVLFYAPKETKLDPALLEELYDTLQRTLKNKMPHIQLGVFLPFDEDTESIEKSHMWLLNKAITIDFISFDANRNSDINFEDTSDKNFMKSQNYHMNKTKRLKQFLKRNKIEKPLFLDIWNTLTGDSRYSNGTFFRAALIFNTVLELSQEVQGLGFWINNEIHERVHNSQDLVSDGLELFHYFDGKRPVYYAMFFKERLYGTVLSEGENHLLTQNEDGYQIALFHERNFNPRYSVDDLFLREHSKELQVKIENLEPGEYQVTRFKFDRKNGALYDNLRKINSKYGINQEVMKYIISTTTPDVEINDELIDGKWSFYAYMDINSIHFIELKKIEPDY